MRSVGGPSIRHSKFAVLIFKESPFCRRLASCIFENVSASVFSSVIQEVLEHMFGRDCGLSVEARVAASVFQLSGLSARKSGAAYGIPNLL